MAYNLPPPWDPGYALPDNVRDEGLQRRGFVTKQMPRGTYDQPEVGTGGYVVPQYVMDEGYGQGTFTTKWEPRGEYDGGKIPYWLNNRPKVLSERKLRGGGRAITMAAPVMVRPNDQGSATAMFGLPEAPLPPQFVNYGEQAADVIINRVAGFPKAQRPAALRSMMDRLDRTLWNRTQAIAAQLVRQGMTPGQAFRPALVRALSAGIAAQVIRAGQTGVAPKSGPLLGLGGDQGLFGLGATGTMISVGTGANAATTGSTNLQASYVTCPGRVLVTTDRDATGVLIPPYWTNNLSGAHKGEPDYFGPGPCPVVTSGGAGGITGDVAAGQAAPWTGPMFQAGPFLFPYKEGAKLLFMPSTITPEQKASILDAIAKASSRVFAMQALATGGGSVTGVNTSGYQIDNDSITRMFGTGNNRIMARDVASGSVPLFRVKDSSTGKYWGLVLGDLGTPEKPGFTLKLVSWNVNWLGKLVDGITEFIGMVIDVLGDLACSLINKPGASTTLASTGNPYGVAAAVGVEAVKSQGVCAPTAPAPPMPQPSSFPILPVAIAGGALVAVVLLMKKPKKKTP